jgi:hypothetical protein
VPPGFTGLSDSRAFRLLEACGDFEDAAGEHLRLSGRSRRSLYLRRVGLAVAARVLKHPTVIEDASLGLTLTLAYVEHVLTGDSRLRVSEDYVPSEISPCRELRFGILCRVLAMPILRV